MQPAVSYQTLIRIAVVGAAISALYFLSDLVAVLLLAVVIASAIEPGVRWFERYRVPRVVGVLIIFLVGLTVLGGVLYLAVPVLIAEVNAFLEAFPRYQRVLLQELRAFQELPFVQPFTGGAEEFILNPPFDLQAIGLSALGAVFAVFGGVFSGIILLVVSFYLASQAQGIEQFLRMITPLHHETYVLDLWSRSQAKIGQWLRGQLLLGLIIGAAVFVALTFLGIPHALILALLAAVLELVPIIGPILAAVPAVFFALLTSPLLALVVAAVYVLIQQLEAHLLVPTVMRRTVGLNPLVVIIALLVGGKLAGVLGVLLAVPLAAVAMEFLSDLDRKRRAIPEPDQAPAH